MSLRDSVQNCSILATGRPPVYCHMVAFLFLTETDSRTGERKLLWVEIQLQSFLKLAVLIPGLPTHLICSPIECAPIWDGGRKKTAGGMDTIG